MDKIVAMGVAYRSLIRNVDLRSKFLPLGNAQINLAFHSLNRNVDLRSKLLTLG